MSLASGLLTAFTNIGTEVKGKASRTGGGKEAVVDLGNITGTVTLDCSAGSIFHGIPTGNITTLTISNIPASGTGCTITFIMKQGATARTCVAPSGTIHWQGISPGTPVNSKWETRTFTTYDAGSNWVAGWSQDA